MSITFDKEFFEWSIIYLNQKWLVHTSYLITDTKYFVLLSLPLLVVYFIKNKRECLYFICSALVLILVSESLVSILKYSFGRLRPGVSTGLYLKTNAYSFPSAHAWNSMALLSFTGLWFRKYFYLCISLSILIGIARFLDNNHFMLDIVFGWLGGFILGYLFYRFAAFYASSRRLRAITRKASTSSAPSNMLNTRASTK